MQSCGICVLFSIASKQKVWAKHPLPTHFANFCFHGCGSLFMLLLFVMKHGTIWHRITFCIALTFGLCILSQSWIYFRMLGFHFNGKQTKRGKRRERENERDDTTRQRAFQKRPREDTQFPASEHLNFEGSCNYLGLAPSLCKKNLPQMTQRSADLIHCNSQS